MIELPHGFMLETMPVPPGFTMAAFAADQRETLPQAWRDQGELYFTAWLDGTAPWGERRVMALCPKSVDTGTTAIGSRMIRRFVKAMNVTAVLVTMEAWVAELPDTGNEGPHAARAKLPKDLKDYEHRKECLWMSLEQRGIDQQAWRAAIHRDPDRIDRFVPFEPGGMQGKLVSWFAEGVS